MAIEEQFERFYKNIKLTQAQREDAKRKYDGVCGKLHSHYYPDTTYDGSTRFLIGSYGKKTHIRPARDIDVIFIMPPKKFSQYDDNGSNCQSQLLQDIKAILEEKYPDTPIKAFGKVVVLEFADPQHNVEVQPAWENDNGTFTIPNSENGGSWEIVDPRAEIKRIKDSDDQTGKTKALIRMTKKWSELCTARVKSYAIENKVLDFFAINSAGSGYAITVRDFFSYFYNAISDENLRSHLNTALNRATKACDFENEQKLDSATEEWKKIFGDDFPAAEVERSAVFTFLQKIASLEARYPSENEEHLDADYGISFAIDPLYKIKIDTQVTQNGFRPGWLSDFLQRRLLLKKRKRLIFSIRSNNVPIPYSVMWKVRNFGDEAKNSNDLRGEISYDEGYNNKEESTKYYGEHYVECYVVKDGSCVACDRILVPIGNEYE